MLLESAGLKISDATRDDIVNLILAYLGGQSAIDVLRYWQREKNSVEKAK